MKYKGVALIGCLVLLQIVVARGGTPQPTPDNRGLADYDLVPHEQGIQDFDEAIRLDPPQSAIAYHNKGVSYQNLGKSTEAEQDFAKARELGYVP